MFPEVSPFFQSEARGTALFASLFAIETKSHRDMGTAGFNVGSSLRKV